MTSNGKGLPTGQTLGGVDSIHTPTTADDRARAEQAEMLQLDAEHFEIWLERMQQLNDEALPIAEFTARRMAAQKEWTRERKLAHARLRYRFDRRRRRDDMIDNDTREVFRRQAADLKARMDAETAESGIRRPDTWKGSKGRALRLRIEQEARESVAAAKAAQPPQGPQAKTKAEVISELQMYMRVISDQTGIADLDAASDDELLAAFEDMRAAGLTGNDAVTNLANVRAALELLATAEPSASRSPTAALQE